MLHKATRRNPLFFISPYVFSLSVIGLIGISFCTLGSFYFLIRQCASGEDGFLLSVQENWLSFVVISLPFFVYWIVIFLNAYEFLGYLRICDTEIAFCAPFRKTYRLDYEAIKDIGIDYGCLTVNRQFWIYFGKKRIPSQYVHRINRLPMNQDFMRIQYTPNVLNALCNSLSCQLSKQLQNSKSILRVYKSSDDS